MKSFEKLNNEELSELVELSLENNMNIQKELMLIKETLSEGRRIHEVDLLKLKNSLLTVENNSKSSLSSIYTVDSINKCIESWIISELEKVLKQFQLSKTGTIIANKNKLSFILNLRPGEELVYFEINLNNFYVDYTHSTKIINAIDSHLEYLKDTTYKWRSVNAELRKLKKILCSQKELNQFLRETEVGNLLEGIGISKYAIVNKYYKNIIENRINTQIVNNETFISVFKEHLMFTERTRAIVSQIYDEELIESLNNIVDKKRD